MDREIEIRDIFKGEIFKSFLIYCKHNNMKYMSDLEEFNFNRLNRSYTIKKNEVVAINKRYAKYKSGELNEKILKNKTAEIAKNKAKIKNTLDNKNISQHKIEKNIISIDDLDAKLDSYDKLSKMLNFKNTKIIEIFDEYIFTGFTEQCKKNKKVYMGQLDDNYLRNFEKKDYFSILIDRYIDYRNVYTDILVEGNRHEDTKYKLKIESIFHENNFYTFLNYCKKNNIEYMSDLIEFDFNKLYILSKSVIKERTIFNVLKRYSDYKNEKIRFKIENIFKEIEYREFLIYCKNNNLKYVDELIDFDIEELANSVGYKNNLIDNVVDFIKYEIKEYGINFENNFKRNRVNKLEAYSVDYEIDINKNEENLTYDFEDIPVKKTSKEIIKKEDTKDEAKFDIENISEIKSYLDNTVKEISKIESNLQDKEKEILSIKKELVINISELEVIKQNLNKKINTIDYIKSNLEKNIKEVNSIKKDLDKKSKEIEDINKIMDRYSEYKQKNIKFRIETIYSDIRFKYFLNYCKKKNLVYMDDLKNFNFEKLHEVYGLGTMRILEIKQLYTTYKKYKEYGFKGIVEFNFDAKMDLYNLKIEDIFDYSMFKVFLNYCRKEKLVYMRDLKDFDFDKLYEVEGLELTKVSYIKELYKMYEDKLSSFLMGYINKK